MISFKEFSHVDFVERAEELVEISLRAVRGEVKPVMVKFDCKMIEVLPTSRQPMRDFVDKMMTLEHHSKLSSMSLLGDLDPSSSVPGGRTWTHEGSDPAILSISCIHGFMAADVEAMGTHILVVTDDDKPKAEALAEELGMEIFSHRGHTRPPYYTCVWMAAPC
jgi:microcystin degradation protein MlrC